MPESIQKFDLYVPITKVDAEQRMIWGWASTERRDLQNEVVKTDAIRKALPDYLEWRNIREMHRPSAVGVAKEATIRDMPNGKGEGLWIGAHITDDTAWAKCVPDEDGDATYKGLSVGGEKLAKVGNAITEIRVVEVSLVDRPANPDCKIEVVKVADFMGELQEGDGGVEPEMTIPAKTVAALLKYLGIGDVAKKDFSAKERREDAQSGAAESDGSFPIKTRADVEHAVSDWGRAGSKASDKAHIKQRAKEIGAEDALPDDWKVAESKDVEKAAEATTVQKGMYSVSSLADCYQSLRNVKFYLKNEAQFEGDSEDAKHAGKVSSILQSLADLMVLMVQHEAEEEDEDPNEGVEDGATIGAITMAAEATTVQKRFTAEHKDALVKADSHLEKAAAAHEKMGKRLKKAADMYGETMGVSKAAKKEEPAFDHEAMKDHLAAMQDAHEQMGDHLDVAQSAIGKCMKGALPEGEPEGSEKNESNAEMEKGDMTDEEAEAAVIISLAGKPKALRKYLSLRDKANERANPADLFKAANLPANEIRVQTHASRKQEGDAGFSGEAAPATVEKMVEGMGIAADDPNGVSKAFAKMVTLPGKPGFGRPALSDPTFHGKAGTTTARGGQA